MSLLVNNFEKSEGETVVGMSAVLRNFSYKLSIVSY